MHTFSHAYAYINTCFTQWGGPKNSSFKIPIFSAQNRWLEINYLIQAEKLVRISQLHFFRSTPDIHITHSTNINKYSIQRLQQQKCVKFVDLIMQKKTFDEFLGIFFQNIRMKNKYIFLLCKQKQIPQKKRRRRRRRKNLGFSITLSIFFLKSSTKKTKEQ